MIRRDGYEEFNSEELAQWDTRRLMAHFDTIRAYRSNHSTHAGHRCCEICNEYTGPSWVIEIKPILDEYDAYLEKIKEVLSTREHIPNKQEAKVIRQEKAKAKQNR